MAATPTRTPRRPIDPQIALGTLIVILIAVLVACNLNWDFARKLDFGVVVQYRAALLKGLGITLWLTAVSVATGLLAGILLAAAYRLPFRPLRWLVTVYVEIFRGLPLLVQLFWVHFALPQVTGVPTPVLTSGVIAMTLQASAYLTEIARAGIGNLPAGQWEAAKALSIPPRVAWLRIILPQALKLMLPALANTAISFFKASTVLSALAVGELVTVGNNIAGFTFRPIEVMTAVGLVFFVVGYTFSKGTYRLENLLNRART